MVNPIQPLEWRMSLQMLSVSLSSYHILLSAEPLLGCKSAATNESAAFRTVARCKMKSTELVRIMLVAYKEPLVKVRLFKIRFPFLMSRWANLSLTSSHLSKILTRQVPRLCIRECNSQCTGSNRCTGSLSRCLCPGNLP